MLDLQAGFHNMEHPIRQSLAKVVDPELSEVIFGLLHPDTKQRMSASAALCCPVFKEHVAAPLVYNLTALSSDHNGAAASLSHGQHCDTTAGTADAQKHSRPDAADCNGSAADNAAGDSQASQSGATGEAGSQLCSNDPQASQDNLVASVAGQKESTSHQVKPMYS